MSGICYVLGLFREQRYTQTDNACMRAYGMCVQLVTIAYETEASDGYACMEHGSMVHVFCSSEMQFRCPVLGWLNFICCGSRCITKASISLHNVCHIYRAAMLPLDGPAIQILEGKASPHVQIWINFSYFAFLAGPSTHLSRRRHLR